MCVRTYSNEDRTIITWASKAASTAYTSYREGAGPSTSSTPSTPSIHPVASPSFRKRRAPSEVHSRTFAARLLLASVTAPTFSPYVCSEPSDSFCRTSSECNCVCSSAFSLSPMLRRACGMARQGVGVGVALKESWVTRVHRMAAAPCHPRRCSGMSAAWHAKGLG
eukprot:365231-Chlamydomonas_euryale.AAC.2